MFIDMVLLQFRLMNQILIGMIFQMQILFYLQFLLHQHDLLILHIFLYFYMFLKTLIPHIAEKTGPTRKARIIANHQLVFALLHDARQDQH